MDDDFENIYTGEEVEKMKQELNKEILKYRDQVQKLLKDNSSLKEENEKIKQDYSKLQQTILQNAQILVKSELERSKVIEENQEMKEYINKNNLTDVANLFKWRFPDESRQLILDQVQQIEEQKQIPKRNSDSKKQYGISVYSTFSLNNK